MQSFPKRSIRYIRFTTPLFYIRYIHDVQSRERTTYATVEQGGGATLLIVLLIPPPKLFNSGESNQEAATVVKNIHRSLAQLRSINVCNRGHASPRAWEIYSHADYQCSIERLLLLLTQLRKVSALLVRGSSAFPHTSQAVSHLAAASAARALPHRTEFLNHHPHFLVHPTLRASSSICFV